MKVVAIHPSSSPQLQLARALAAGKPSGVASVESRYAEDERVTQRFAASTAVESPGAARKTSAAFFARFSAPKRAPLHSPVHPAGRSKANPPSG
jgi:hypothetical protein